MVSTCRCSNSNSFTNSIFFFACAAAFFLGTAFFSSCGAAVCFFDEALRLSVGAGIVDFVVAVAEEVSVAA
jgi:hypothetical protein